MKVHCESRCLYVSLDSKLTLKEVPMLTDQFLIDLKQKYIDTICTFNQDKTVETRQWDFPTKLIKIIIVNTYGIILSNEEDTFKSNCPRKTVKP